MGFLTGLCSCAELLRAREFEGGGGYAIQHGPNPETRREFPGVEIRMWEPPQQIERYPAVAEWLDQIHQREGLNGGAEQV